MKDQEVTTQYQHAIPTLFYPGEIPFRNQGMSTSPPEWMEPQIFSQTNLEEHLVPVADPRGSWGLDPPYPPFLRPQIYILRAKLHIFLGEPELGIPLVKSWICYWVHKQVHQMLEAMQWAYLHSQLQVRR